METIDVCFYATMRQMVGAKHVPVDLPAGAAVRDLLGTVTNRFPALAPFIWDARGGLGDYIKVFVDGREIRHLQGLDTVIPAGATVDIFPPAAGG